MERDEKAVNKLAVEALAELPTEDRSAVWAMLKERSKSTHDEVTGSPGSTNRRPRKGFDTTLLSLTYSPTIQFCPLRHSSPSTKSPHWRLSRRVNFMLVFARDWPLSQSKLGSMQHLDTKSEDP